jgi:hypothetical protein
MKTQNSPIGVTNTCMHAGVNISLMQHSLMHGTPDAVFPNNWFSTHAAAESHGNTKENTLVLYPMKCPNRAAERRPELMDFVKARGYEGIVDLTDLEKGDGARFFEGTGVLVIDRPNGVAYVSISERADRTAAEQYDPHHLLWNNKLVSTQARIVAKH